MGIMIKQPFRMNREIDRERSRHFRIIRFSDNTLLAGSFVAAMVASIGVAGYVWPETNSLKKYALTFSVFVSPAFLALSIMELFNQGRTWKRCLALAFSVAAVTLVGLAFHEVLSTHPILSHP